MAQQVKDALREQIIGLDAIGISDATIERITGVTARTIRRWRAEDPEYVAAVNSQTPRAQDLVGRIEELRRIGIEVLAKGMVDPTAAHGARMQAAIQVVYRTPDALKEAFQGAKDFAALTDAEKVKWLREQADYWETTAQVKERVVQESAKKANGQEATH